MTNKELLDSIPEYNRFFTVDEMDERTRVLAERYPDTVKLSEVGRSRNGHPLIDIEIGNGAKNALVFGTPHPNELVGTVTIDYFARALAENADLRESLGYTWHFVKTADPDGAKLNEGWFSGKLDIYHYCRNFFRSAFDQQCDWSFPVTYKDYTFDRPTEEAKALMRMIDGLDPAFIYSLHNAGMGGCYWFLTYGEQALYEELHASAREAGVPINLGEPEIPYAPEFYPAVYKLTSVPEKYEYLAKYKNCADPASEIVNGANSDGYANRNGIRSNCLVCELPYFCFDEIEDNSPSDISRCEAIRLSAAHSIEIYSTVERGYSRISPYIAARNQYHMALTERVKSRTGSAEAKIKWAESREEFKKAATVSQKADNLYVSRFYDSTALGLLVRDCEYALATDPTLGFEARNIITGEMNAADEMLKKECDYIEKNLNYTLTPIKDMVRVQLQCGLAAAHFAWRNRNER